MRGTGSAGASFIMGSSPGRSPVSAFKFYGYSGHVAMWGRTMPGTKQLILNGSDERYLSGGTIPSTPI
jgi:hypothetical protein